MKYIFNSDEELKAFINENIITTMEVAELLDCSRQNIDKLVQRNNLNPVKQTQRDKLFLKSDVLKRMVTFYTFTIEAIDNHTKDEALKCLTDEINNSLVLQDGVFEVVKDLGSCLQIILRTTNKPDPRLVQDSLITEIYDVNNTTYETMRHLRNIGSKLLDGYES